MLWDQTIQPGEGGPCYWLAAAHGSTGRPRCQGLDVWGKARESWLFLISQNFVGRRKITTSCQVIRSQFIIENGFFRIFMAQKIDIPESKWISGRSANCRAFYLQTRTPYRPCDFWWLWNMQWFQLKLTFFWALIINVLFAKLPFLMGKSQLFTPPFLTNHHFCWQTLTISMGWTTNFCGLKPGWIPIFVG